MDPNKIAFITCVNDWAAYEEMKRYIEALEIPEGVSLAFHPIEDAPSMAAGYNRGMKQSDAKYKVYLHQDVLILHQGFIRDVLALFQCHPQIGMIGVIGAQTLPPNGIWWESKNTVGRVFGSHTGYMSLLDLGEVNGAYVPVQAVDGLIMVTQYDIPWREDLFTGWYFYDVSQCMEFLRAGFEVAVPTQSQPWCMHDCGVVNTRNGYEEYRQVLLQHYFESPPAVQPLNPKPFLSICIPTYRRATELKQCLQNIFDQIGAEPQIEVVVSDNASPDETSQIVRRFADQYSNLSYYRNRENVGPDRNILLTIEKAKGKYVFLHGDDDYFLPGSLYRIFHIVKQRPDCCLFFVNVINNDKTVEIHHGMDTFLQINSYRAGFLSSVILKKTAFEEVEEPERFVGTRFNHLYLLYEILSKHPRFCQINDNIYTYGQGEMDEYLIGEVFIRHYLEILHFFHHRGLSEQCIRDEKKQLINFILLVLYHQHLKHNPSILQGFYESIQRYYQDEPYYQEIWDYLSQVKT